MTINQYTLGVSTFVASAALFLLATLVGFFLRDEAQLSSIFFSASLLIITAGLLLRKRHFRWICGLVAALMAIVGFFGQVMPGTSATSETENIGVDMASMAWIALLTALPLIASYFLLFNGAFRKAYGMPTAQRPAIDAAFKVSWITLLLFAVILTVRDIVVLFGVP